MNAIHRRPALGVFAVLSAGTLLGLRLEALGFAALLASAACVAAALWALRRDTDGAARNPRLATCATWAAVALCGYAVAAGAGPRRFLPPPAAGQADKSTGIELIGWVASDSERRADATAATAVWSFTVQVESNRVPGAAWAPSRGELRVRWFGPAFARGPAYGDRLALAGALTGARDRPTLTTGRHASKTLSSGHGSWLGTQAFRMRAVASRRLSAGIAYSPRTIRVLDGLMLGYRAALGFDLRDLFVRTGTLHLFAISGQHVCMLAGMIVVILKGMRMSRLLWVLPLAPALTFYTLATGAEASAVRACVMGIVFFAAPLLGRRADTLSALAASAVLIVLARPSDLVDIGFILSFTVTAGMVVLVPLLCRAGRLAAAKVAARGSVGPAREWDKIGAPPPSAARRAGRWLAGAIGTLAAFSVSAWIVSAPTTAYFFGRFTPVALLSNIVVIPLAYLVVLCGCLSLVSGFAGLWVSATFNHANVVLVSSLLWVTEALTAVPLGNAVVTPPPAALVWLAFAAMGVGAAAAGHWLDTYEKGWTAPEATEKMPGQ